MIKEECQIGQDPLANVFDNLYSDEPAFMRNIRVAYPKGASRPIDRTVRKLRKPPALEEVDAFWATLDPAGPAPDRARLATQRYADALIKPMHTTDPRQKLEIRQDRIIFHGDVAESSNSYLPALMHAQKFWGGRITLKGPEDFKVKMWAHAQVMGVEVLGYVPSREMAPLANGIIESAVASRMQREGIKSLGGFMSEADCLERDATTGPAIPRSPAEVTQKVLERALRQGRDLFAVREDEIPGGARVDKSPPKPSPRRP